MVNIPYNDIFKLQNRKLVSATFKKAVLVRINLEAWTGDVYIIGNQNNILKNVPFASSVNLSEVQIGDKCRLDLFDETNPSDMVIAYVYGKGKVSREPIFASGTTSISTGGTTVPHGLGELPDVVTFHFVSDPQFNKTASDPQGGLITYTVPAVVWEHASPDATNIYLTSSFTFDVKWYVIKF